MAMLSSRADHARILVVDDDESSREGLAKVLRGEGFVVDCAADGHSALEQVSGFDPDVVLTDLRMPRVDGIELCARLRDVDPELPVILMTVQDDAASILRGLRAGIDDYLPKPLDIDLVFRSLRHAIGKRAIAIEQRQLRVQNAELCAETQAALKRYDEVLSVVSHDLRNPLAVIHLCSQRLLEECPELGSRPRTTAATIARSVARSNRLIDNLLDETRLRGDGVTLERREHAIDDLLGDVRDLRPLALHRGLVLHIEPAPPDRTLLCDRAKMAQVLSNLVGNAIKFSPSGATVRVWAESCDDALRFGVSDHGPGIAAEAQPHLFERFWQSPGGKLAGLGLGLYIARGIVAAHGGRIWFESDEGSGSTFFVSLPCA